MANLKISQLTPGNPAQSGDVIPIERSDVNFSITAGSIAALAPAGTVTSVGFEGDGVLLSSVESGPITSSGILSATLLTQNENLVLAGPTSGSAATPTFRTLVIADLPSIPWSSLANPAGNLTLSMGTDTTTFNQTANTVWLWANTTTGTGSTTNASPLLELAANYYTGSTSAQDTWAIGSALAAGTNGKSLLSFTHSGSTGAAQVSFPASSGVPGIVFNGGTVGIGVGVGTSVQIETGRASLQLHDVTDSVTYGIFSGNNNGNGLAIECGVTNGAVIIGANSGFMNPYTSNNAYCILMGADVTGANAVPFQGTTSSGLQTNISEVCTFSPASGSTSFVAHNIAPTINASGSSGNFTALKVNPTMTAAPTGTNLLLDLQVGGASKFSVSTVGHIDNCVTDAQGSVSSAPTGIVASNVVVAVGAAAATFTVSSTEGFTVGDTVNLSASGWTAGSGLASTVATVASVTSTTVMVLTYVSGGPWVAGTYTAQTGTLAQTGGTSVSVKYAVAYTSTPTVVVTPTSNTGAFYISASSTTGFTITYANSGTQTFNYMVMGNPT